MIQFKIVASVGISTPSHISENIPSNIKVLDLLNTSIDDGNTAKMNSLLTRVSNPLENCGRNNNPMHHIIDAYFETDDLVTKNSLIAAFKICIDKAKEVDSSFDPTCWPRPNNEMEIESRDIGDLSDYQIQQEAGEEEVLSLEDYFYEKLEDKDENIHQEFFKLVTNYN
jgi:hypothetical protein